jgi:nucleoside-diphosphate-sugar epimerase
MRILVTGATGFIGSHVVRELLARGHDPHALARPGSSLHRLADIRDRISIVEGDLDVPSTAERVITDVQPAAIVHLAWYAEPGRYAHDVAANLASLRASTRVLEAALRGSCPRVVLGGTCLENGDGPTRSIYQACKRAIHEVAAGFGDPGPSVACGHVFYLYGPGEDERRVVPTVIRALLRSEPVPTTDGAQERDYLHVADVAAAFCTLAETAVRGGIDICSGSTVRLRDVFDIIAAETRGGALLQVGDLGPALDEGQPATGDPRPLRDLGWQPAHDLRGGIIDSINWWRREGART